MKMKNCLLLLSLSLVSAQTSVAAPKLYLNYRCESAHTKFNIMLPTPTQDSDAKDGLGYVFHVLAHDRMKIVQKGVYYDHKRKSDFHEYTVIDQTNEKHLFRINEDNPSASLLQWSTGPAAQPFQAMSCTSHKTKVLPISTHPQPVNDQRVEAYRNDPKHVPPAASEPAHGTRPSTRNKAS